MKTKQPWLLILILVFGLLLSGCGLNTLPTENTTQLTEVMQRVQSTLTQIAVETLFPDVEPTFTATVVPPTKTPQPEPTATNTPMPTVQPPTNTPMPTSPQLVPEVRIYLGTQGTNITIVGMVKANTTQRYVFKGLEGQLLDITLTSVQESTISVVGRDGTVLSQMGASKNFRGNLPSTQDWFIDIRAAGSNLDFSLVVMLP